MNDADLVDAYQLIWAAATPGISTQTARRWLCVNLMYEIHGLQVFHSVSVELKARRNYGERLVVIDPSKPIIADRLLGAYDSAHLGVPIVLDELSQLGDERLHWTNEQWIEVASSLLLRYQEYLLRKDHQMIISVVNDLAGGYDFTGEGWLSEYYGA